MFMNVDPGSDDAKLCYALFLPKPDKILIGTPLPSSIKTPHLLIFQYRHLDQSIVDDIRHHVKECPNFAILSIYFVDDVKNVDQMKKVMLSQSPDHFLYYMNDNPSYRVFFEMKEEQGSEFSYVLSFAAYPMIKPIDHYVYIKDLTIQNEEDGSNGRSIDYAALPKVQKGESSLIDGLPTTAQITTEDVTDSIGRAQEIKTEWSGEAAKDLEALKIAIGEEDDVIVPKIYDGDIVIQTERLSHTFYIDNPQDPSNATLIIILSISNINGYFGGFYEPKIVGLIESKKRLNFFIYETCNKEGIRNYSLSELVSGKIKPTIHLKDALIVRMGKISSNVLELTFNGVNVSDYTEDDSYSKIMAMLDKFEQESEEQAKIKIDRLRKEISREIEKLHQDKQ